MDLTDEALETCKACEGSGWLGVWGKYKLLCETCEGWGIVLRERASTSPPLPPATPPLRGGSATW